MVHLKTGRCVFNKIQWSGLCVLPLPASLATTDTNMGCLGFTFKKVPVYVTVSLISLHFTLIPAQGVGITENSFVFSFAFILLFRAIVFGKADQLKLAVWSFICLL